MELEEDDDDEFFRGIGCCAWLLSAVCTCIMMSRVEGG